jgi:hypothetical protein
MRDLRQYTRILLFHWVYLMSGISAVAISIWLNLSGSPAMESRAFWAIAIICFLYAGFKTWKEGPPLPPHPEGVEGTGGISILAIRDPMSEDLDKALKLYRRRSRASMLTRGIRPRTSDGGSVNFGSAHFFVGCSFQSTFSLQKKRKEASAGLHT